jgi:hypothetical protein
MIVEFAEQPTWPANKFCAVYWKELSTGTVLMGMAASVAPPYDVSVNDKNVAISTFTQA